MPVDVVTETDIAREQSEVAAFVADPDNAPRRYANIRSVEWKSEPPLRLRSRIAFVAEFLGRRLAYTYEVVEFVPGERLVMRTAQGPVSYTHLRAHETVLDLVCRLLLEKKNN